MTSLLQWGEPQGYTTMISSLGFAERRSPVYLPPGAIPSLVRSPYRCDVHHAAASDCGGSPRHVDCALAPCGQKIVYTSDWLECKTRDESATDITSLMLFTFAANILSHWTSLHIRVVRKPYWFLGLEISRTKVWSHDHRVPTRSVNLVVLEK